jgi:hypothetical protein
MSVLLSREPVGRLREWLIDGIDRTLGLGAPHA